MSEADEESRQHISNLKREIKTEVEEHLESIGLGRSSDQSLSKDAIRKIQAKSRRESAKQEKWILEDLGEHLINEFAEGKEICPEKIDPELCFIDRPDSHEGYLFRMATLIWSIPVSRGYGRRMRFLIRDRANGKLIGLLALGSPVFNLSARDKWIGWSVADRRERLVNVMDAYVLGAVPPYSRLLGAKLIGALATSAEVQKRFQRRYGCRVSVSGAVKNANLVLLTTTSALGRSSVYNRLRLKGVMEYERIGWTKGYGHFHISDETFQKMRELLKKNQHKYASGHGFNDGPNWRIRVVRQALTEVELDPELLNHGIEREVFGVPLVENWRGYLCGETKEIILNRPSVSDIAQAAKERWIVDRAERCPDYIEWTRPRIREIISGRFAEPVSWLERSDERSRIASEPTMGYGFKPPLPRRVEREFSDPYRREASRSLSPFLPYLLSAQWSYPSEHACRTSGSSRSR
jgi:hypothetical protein